MEIQISCSKSRLELALHYQYRQSPSILHCVSVCEKKKCSPFEFLTLSVGLQVKNIGFTGVFRLIFKPLADEFPCFGAVCFSLREKVNISFHFLIVFV